MATPTSSLVSKIIQFIPSPHPTPPHPTPPHHPPQGSSATESSFQWRAGKERTTTGIWMWSEPFIRRVANGEEVAVLLMDTQGMFDNETSMNLTACIFGLSTLLSSYQIYNVQNRIQVRDCGRMRLAGWI